MINPLSVYLSIPSCILWSAFGFSIFELFIILPNLTELLMQLISLCIYYFLPKPIYELQQIVVEMSN